MIIRTIIKTVIAFSGTREARNVQDVLLFMLWYTTFNRKLFTTSSRICAWAIDADKDKCREFVKRRSKQHQACAL